MVVVSCLLVSCGADLLLRWGFWASGWVGVFGIS